jgi:STAS domain-containing protein
MGSDAALPGSSTRSEATLQARHLDDGESWLLELSGEADIATAALLRHELALLATTSRADAVVDVTRLAFCDVASAHRILTARRTRPVTVRGATGGVRRMFVLLEALQAQRLPRYLASGRGGANPIMAGRARAS